MSKIFFSSDHHFFHHNIIEYCDRPFGDINTMKNNIINNHNKMVGKNDIIYVLGDIGIINKAKFFKLKPLLDRMNGRKHLILGNHDESKPFNYIKIGFTSVHTTMWFEYGNHTFYMNHDPAVYTTNMYNPKDILLCGHVHKLFDHLLPKKNVINVGVDVWNFAPISLDRIIKLLGEYKLWH